MEEIVLSPPSADSKLEVTKKETKVDFCLKTTMEYVLKEWPEY